MEFLKTWLLPPAIGAIIGYFTNWLAIKMLFRPLNPVYIGRFKLPFTPGILPRERRRLSDSVGETVSKELLTGEVFRGRLEDPALKGKVEEAVYVIVDEALRKDASTFLHSLSLKVEASGDEAAFSQAESLVLESLKTALSSREVKEALASALSSAISDIDALPIGSILSPKTLESLAARLALSLGEKERQDQVFKITTAGGKAGSTAAGLLSLELKASLLDYGAKALYTRLLPVLEALLASPELKAQLNGLGVSILRKVISRLGPVQRLIVSAANYERSLTESMPETVQDITQALLRLLKDEKTAEHLVQSVHRYVLNPRLTQDGFTTEDTVASGELGQTMKILMDGLGKEGESFAAKLAKGYQSIADLSLGALFPGLSPGISASIAALILGTEEELAGSEKSVLANTGSGLFSRTLATFLNALAKSAAGRSIGEILLLGEKEKRALASQIAHAAVSGISAYAERLVDALDIRKMVVSKIDSLDMAEAERLVLRVVNRELTWITILGGVLGFFIGFIQSLVSLL
ncbi:MAG: DUF445 family protein [Spirochaetales bacterium]|nr:DUF445 family protein [Spirochaetales bacterium]